MYKRALITGANGFVGQTLNEWLMAKGCLTLGLVRNSDLMQENRLVLDIAKSGWDVNPCRGVDTVFHLAAKVHDFSPKEKSVDDYFKVNIEGTRRLLEAARDNGIERFIFFSSVAAVAVDYHDDALQDESSVGMAETPYGQSKFQAEQLVLHGGYVPHPVVIRPSMVYGNTEKGNLPRMIDAIRKGVFPPIPEVHNKRSMVHVEDVVQAALLAADKPEAAGQVYIVTDGHAYSTREIYDWIREALGKPQSSLTMPLALLRAMAKVGDGIGKLRGRRFLFDSDALEKLIGSAWYSSAKIERELGFKPVHDLKSSLPEIVRYLER